MFHLFVGLVRAVRRSVAGGFSRLSEGLDVHDHLLAAQERVANELARAQSHLRVRHDVWLIVVDRGRRRCILDCRGLPTASRRQCAEIVEIDARLWVELIPPWRICGMPSVRRDTINWDEHDIQARNNYLIHIFLLLLSPS